MDGNASLADVMAMTNGNLGGGNSLILIILFVLLFGGGNLFNRQSDFSQFATSASQNEILLGQKFDALSRQVNQVGDGLASSTYALNNAIVGEGRTLQNCCCDLRYEMANQFANANATTTTQTQKILDALAQNKIDSLQNQVSTLQNQIAITNATNGVPKINPYMYGIVPTCGCGNI